MWKNNGKISYTPYTIPESSFLDPIVLSPDIVTTFVVPKATSKPAESTSDLIWARRTIDVPAESWEDVVSEHTWIEDEAIDHDDIKSRQRYAESADNPRAVSKTGAKGLYQIMKGAYTDYVKATGKTGDLFDPIFNERVRDWYMDQLGKSKTISGGNPSEKVKLAKQLAAYNWGIGNLGKHLEKMKKSTDIYNSLDWMKGMPQETIDYVNFILLKTGSGFRSEESYKKHKMKYS